MAEKACTVGKGIQISGSISGAGDLLVEGRVEGHVALQDLLEVEETGILVADTETRELVVRGKMSGNSEASDRVGIMSTATVIGDIRAPRVVIEDGARFRGRIEMDVPLPDDI